MIRLYITLFLAFFRAGLFAVGGGLATLPFLREIAVTYDWFSLDELMNMIAVSESTPGPIGVNMATYGGFEAGGILGGVISTLGLVTPSVIVVILVSKVLKKFQESAITKNVFYGLRPASAGLIAGAVFEVFVQGLFRVDQWGVNMRQFFRYDGIILFLVLFLLIQKKPRIHPIVFIIAGGVFGVIFQMA